MTDTDNHQGEAVILGIFTVLFAVLSVPAGLYVLSFGWLTAGVVGYVSVVIAVSVCCMPFYCGYATHQRWHGKEVAG